MMAKTLTMSLVLLAMATWSFANVAGATYIDCNSGY